MLLLLGDDFSAAFAPLAVEFIVFSAVLLVSLFEIIFGLVRFPRHVSVIFPLLFLMVLFVEDAALGPMTNILLSYRLRLFVFDGMLLAVLLERAS